MDDAIRLLDAVRFGASTERAIFE